MCMFACLMVFNHETLINTTFNNISVASWLSVLLVEETGGPGENHWPVAGDWQTWSHNVVHLVLIEIRTHISGDRHWLHIVRLCKSNYHTITTTMASQECLSYEYNTYKYHCNMNAFFSFDRFMIYIPECAAKNYDIIHADTRYCTLNLGCSCITLREPCNNQRPRCDITWLHVTNHLYHGFLS